MSKPPLPLKSYHVYRLVDGEWKFWMNARGKSAKQLHHSVWWHTKAEVLKEHIRVVKPNNRAGERREP